MATACCCVALTVALESTFPSLLFVLTLPLWLFWEPLGGFPPFFSGFLKRKPFLLRVIVLLFPMGSWVPSLFVFVLGSVPCLFLSILSALSVPVRLFPLGAMWPTVIMTHFLIVWHLLHQHCVFPLPCSEHQPHQLMRRQRKLVDKCRHATTPTKARLTKKYTHLRPHVL